MTATVKNKLFPPTIFIFVYKAFPPIYNHNNDNINASGGKLLIKLLSFLHTYTFICIYICEHNIISYKTSEGGNGIWHRMVSDVEKFSEKPSDEENAKTLFQYGKDGKI